MKYIIILVSSVFLIKSIFEAVKNIKFLKTIEEAGLMPISSYIPLLHMGGKMFICIKGNSISIDEMSSPVNGTRCLYYRVKVLYQHIIGRGGSHLEKVLELKRDAQFVIDDGTAKLLVRPENAEIAMYSSYHKVKFSELSEEMKLAITRTGFNEKNFFGNEKELEITEKYLLPGDLYIVGLINATEEDGNVVIEKDKKAPLFISSSKEQSQKYYNNQLIFNVVVGLIAVIVLIFILI